MIKKIQDWKNAYLSMSHYERSLYVFGLMVKYIIISTAIFVALTFTPSAHAAEDTQQLAQDTILAASKSAADPDISGMGMLCKLFGGIVDNPLNPSSLGGVGDTALGQIFGVINMSILALGALFLAYNVSAGVAQTAQDGEFLGKRFSTLWLPIRLGAGITSLVPVFHGWALCQLIVLYAAQIGVGVGNLATYAVTDYLDKGGTVVNVPTSAVNSKFVVELYKINLCVSGINTITGSSVMGERVAGGVANFGTAGNSECGAVQLPHSLLNAKAQAASLAAYQLADAMIKAHTDSLAKSIAATFKTDGSATSKISIVADADIISYGEIYQETLRRNLSAALNSQTHLVHDLKNEGFIGLGSYYSQMSGAADAYNQAQQTQASVIKPAPLSDATVEATNWIYVRAEQYIAGLDDNSKAGLIVGAAVRPVSDENAIIAEFLKKSASSIPASCNNTSNAPNDPTILARVIDATGCDPSALSRMKNTGDYLSILGWIGIGLAATAKVSGSIPIIGESLKTFADIFLTLMETMTFFATMLSTYLPLLPYIAWLGAIISWLTVVIEGVVAAPLWAFAHLDSFTPELSNQANQPQSS